MVEFATDFGVVGDYIPKEQMTADDIAEALQPLVAKHGKSFIKYDSASAVHSMLENVKTLSQKHVKLVPGSRRRFLPICVV